MHDLSDGGLLVALTEMAMAGGIGADIRLPETCDAIAFLFGEDQARYLLAVSQSSAQSILDEARAAGVPAASLGAVGGAIVSVAGQGEIALDVLKAAHENWLPSYMAAAN